jgi:hypothetical protein
MPHPEDRLMILLLSLLYMAAFGALLYVIQ